MFLSTFEGFLKKTCGLQTRTSTTRYCTWIYDSRIEWQDFNQLLCSFTRVYPVKLYQRIMPESSLGKSTLQWKRHRAFPTTPSHCHVASILEVSCRFQARGMLVILGHTMSIYVMPYHTRPPLLVTSLIFHSPFLSPFQQVVACLPARTCCAPAVPIAWQ